MTFPSPGADWPKIDAYLKSLGIRIDNPTLGETEGGGHVPGSEHFQHRARDYPTSSCDAPAVAKALEPFAHGPHAVIDELFFSPLRIWYDSGNWFQPAAGAIEYRNHFSHVHAGIARGASLPTRPGPTPQPQPAPKPPPAAEEDDMAGVFLTDVVTSTWWLFDGVYRRPVGKGENQTLIDLGLVKPGPDGKPFVKRVPTEYLNAIPVAAGYP